jgi:GTP cyclohydrolase I
LSDKERALTFLAALLPQYDWQHDKDLQDTPRRYVEAMKEMCEGEPFKFTTFVDETDEMVMMRDIAFYSMCEHHLLPFFGKAHVGYLPQGQIAGLSKLARAVKFHSRGLWTQERLTTAVHDTIEIRLQPLGVAVVMEARHLCMEMRGVSSPGATTTTSKMSGVFRDNTNQARQEFLRLIHPS